MAQPVERLSVQPARGTAPIMYSITAAGYAALATDPKTDRSRDPKKSPPMRIRRSRSSKSGQ